MQQRSWNFVLQSMYVQKFREKLKELKEIYPAVRESELIDLCKKT